jgi:eukaryotic-like serine/threonine-protein kinase
LSRDGVVKLLDFGIGGLKQGKAALSSTLSGAAMGTPAFMAPEQARGRWHEVDGQTDLWALGASLFTLLTGQYVHEAETVNETLALAVTQPARSIKTLRADLPERAAALVDRALAYAKEQRFPDARAMQAEVRLLYAALAGQDVSQAQHLSIPDPGPPPSAPRSASDPRPRLTTGRGVSSSGSPGAILVGLASSSRPRHWAVAAGGLATLVVLGVLGRSCGEQAGWATSPAATAASPGVERQPAPGVAAAIGSGTALAPPEQASAVPKVSIDQLPREPRRQRARPPRQ